MVQYLPSSGSNYIFLERPSFERRDLPNSVLAMHAYEFHLYKEDMFVSGYVLEKWGEILFFYFHDTVRKGNPSRLQSL